MELWKQSLIKGTIAMFLMGIFFGGLKSWLNTEVVYTFASTDFEVVEKALVQAADDSPPESEGTVEREVPARGPIEEYIYEVFGEEEGARGIKMLKECENKNLDPEAVNDWNSNGTWDAGLWQINEIHGYTKEQLFDPYFNTDVAYKIYKSWGSTFSAWTCSYIIGDVSFWQR